MVTILLSYRMAYGDEVDLDYHMMPYHSYKSGHQDRDSQTIVYLKGNGVYDDERRQEFIVRVMGWLRGCIREVKQAHPSDKILVGIAPGHAPGSVSFMVTELNIESLSKGRVLVDPNMLQRYRKVPKQATSDEPQTIHTHLTSINVVGDVAGKVVCILDDVWTTGCTLTGCHQLVSQKGPKSIYLLAIGKTVHMDEYDDSDSDY